MSPQETEQLKVLQQLGRGYRAMLGALSCLWGRG